MLATISPKKGKKRQEKAKLKQNMKEVQLISRRDIKSSHRELQYYIKPFLLLLSLLMIL